MADARSCIMCGCAVGDGEMACPMCGTPVGAAPSGAIGGASGGTAAAPAHGLHAKRPGPARLFADRRKLVALVAAAAAVLIVAVVLVARLWLADRDLHEQAADADSSLGGISAPVQAMGDAGIDSGNVAAGGIVNAHAGVLYETSTDGVFFRDEDDSESADSHRLTSQGAFDLNVSEADGRLVYLAISQGGRSSFEGDSINSVEMDAGESAGVSQASLLYEPSAPDAKISCLSVVDSTSYFLERSSGEYLVKKLDGGASSAETLYSAKADSAWLFVERDAVYLVSVSKGAWSARSASLSSSELDFTEVAKGTGELATAAVEGGRLYYALSSESDDVRLQRDDLKNGSLEYADIVNPVRVAASGDVVAVMTKSGQLIWMDAVTGVSHDLTKALEKANSGIVPTSSALSVYGEWVCVADGKDGFCRINVNDGGSVPTV